MQDALLDDIVRLMNSDGSSNDYCNNGAARSKPVVWVVVGMYVLVEILQ